MRDNVLGSDSSPGRPYASTGTYEDMLKAASLMTYKSPGHIKEWKSLIKEKFEKIMNRLGWYRQTTVYLIDSSTFKHSWMLQTVLKPDSKDETNFRDWQNTHFSSIFKNEVDIPI